MTQEHEDFKRWLKSNRSALANRTPDEVALLARLVGFDVLIICEILSHFKDALQGSSFENKSKMQAEIYTYTIELMSGKVFLDDQWRAVRDKQNFDVDFEEAI